MDSDFLDSLIISSFCGSIGGLERDLLLKQEDTVNSYDPGLQFFSVE